MELIISIILGLMIIGAVFALHAKDLLSAVINMGFVGFGLVICFLLLKAPDLAMDSPAFRLFYIGDAFVSAGAFREADLPLPKSMSVTRTSVKPCRCPCLRR